MREIMTIILALVSISALAQSPKEQSFKDMYFTSQIESRFCGKNSEKLIQKWQDLGLNLENAEIWNVTNVGFQYFGLIKYYQNRWERFYSFPYEGNPDYMANGSGGWYFHAFVVSDGFVYDFSYKQQPTITKLNDYILDMFVLKTDTGKYFYEKAKYGLEAIKGYKIEAYPAKEYLEQRENNRSTSEVVVDCGRVDEFIYEDSKTTCF